MTSDAEALCLAIEAAFTSAASRPHRAGRPARPGWRSISFDELKAIDDELSFLTPDQYRYSTRTPIYPHVVAWRFA
jgi:hypothetical protein